jgi:hypothetical protein
VIDTRLLTRAKESLTTVDNEEGSASDVKNCVSLNAFAAIDVVDSGNEYDAPGFRGGYIKSVLWLNRTPSIPLNVVLPVSTVIDSRL